MALKIQFSLFLLSVFFIGTKGQLVLPNDYQKCNISATNFNDCARKSFGELIHMAIEGIPSLGIAPLDPTHVSHLCFLASGNAAISMTADLWNTTLEGFSEIQIVSTEGTDLKNKNVIQLKGEIPETKIIGDYTVNGKILTFPFTGSGVVEFIFYNFTMDQQTYHQPVTRNGKTYLPVKNITVDVNVASGNIVYASEEPDASGKSFGLSDIEINNILNQHFMAIFQEYLSNVNEMIVSLISPRMVRFYNEVPFEDLFVK